MPVLDRLFACLRRQAVALIAALVVASPAMAGTWTAPLPGGGQVTGSPGGTAMASLCAYYQCTCGPTGGSFNVTGASCYPLYDPFGRLNAFACDAGTCTTPSRIVTAISNLSCSPTEVRTSEGCVPAGKQFDEGKQCKGNPIALNTGGKFGAAEDFRAEGPDVLALDRAYLNDRTSWSNGQTRPPMGRGWRRSVDIAATYVGTASATEAPLRVTINFPDNRQRMFRLEGSAYVLSYYDDGFAIVGRKGDWAQMVKTATALELTENDDTVYVFDFQGRLVQIRWRGGYFQNLSYDATTGLNTAIVDKHGRQLTFSYNANGLMTSVTTPDTRVVKYEYVETFNWQGLLAQYGFTTTPADRLHTDWALKTVIYPDDTPATDADNPRVVYHYENTSFPDYLTGITDERGIRIATYTYSADGRATITEGPGGVRRTQLSYGPTAGAVTETNPLLKQAITTFESDGQFRQRLKRVDGQASANCVASNSQYGYDANNWLNSVTDEEGRITAYTNDIRGRRTQIVEAQGTPQARTTSITWNATYNLPDQIVAPGLTTAFTYDTAGRVLTATETDTTTGTVPYSTNGQTRTTTYTYTAAGLVDTIDGPLAGTTDRIDYDYNAAGYVTRIANGLGHITQITALDGAGRPLTVIDPSGVTTNMVYNPRGWPLSITVNPGTGQAVTSFQYTLAGDVSRMTMPDGSTLDYAYDDARRLVSITNGANERIEYTYDAMDNVTREVRRAPGGTIAVDARRAYDELGRLLKVIGADNRETVSGYDKVGNQTSWRDPRPQTWSFVFDALDRLTRTTEPTTAQTNTTYVPQDEPAQVTDARTNATVYVRNGWGEAIQETSPDRGTIVYIRDVRGLVTQMTDGRGLVTNYTYDGLGRMLTRTFPGVPAETVTWAHDATASGNRGIGRLTSVTDGAGALSITYNALGQETRHRRTFGSTGYNTDFTYDAAGNVLTVIYPSGRRAIYTRDALGRVTTVTTRPSATGTVSTVVSGIAWRPFGPVAGMTFGNNLVASFSYDLDGRLTGIATSGSGANVQGLTYGYDPADNIVSITDSLAAARSQTFVYDSVNRITSATGPYGTIGYAYDLVGNRTSRTVTLPVAGTETYTTPANSNRLSGISGAQTRGLTWLGSGVAANDNRGAGTGLPGTWVYSYDRAGRMVTAARNGTTALSARYDGLERRVEKTAGTAVTRYIYDPDGQILAEINAANGQAIREYIWLGGLPVGLVERSSGSAVLRFVHADHLARPQKITAANRSLVWDGQYAPFGETHSVTGSITNALLFPGQLADPETGLSQNWHRDYDPTLGRYLQPDPLGLTGGVNTFAYAGGNPLTRVDRWGLTTFVFGGAGNEGEYLDDLVQQLSKQGIRDVRTVPSASSGFWAFDALTLPSANDWPLPGGGLVQTPGVGPSEGQYNLVGYSWGAVAASQQALGDAAFGRCVDNLVLIGAPINASLLEALRNEPRIKNLIIRNITGDPIYAGMSDAELFVRVPQLITQQMLRSGHFLYVGDAGARVQLAQQLWQAGLR